MLVILIILVLVVLILVLVVLTLVLVISLLGAKGCAAYSPNRSSFKPHSQPCEAMLPIYFTLKKIVLSKVEPPNQSGAEVGCTSNRPSSAGCLAN